MRILKLKLKNINSLAGENEIDFTQPIFTNDGLFAITGKTGAGKSSILDAISLALYGKTPRVDITGTSNPVMTRGENDCYAEIEFQVNGEIWKSSWKQELTRTGNLKPVSRQIATGDGKIKADQVRSCDTKIVKILGLTFEQFTKVIMLAQGSFAAFLQAGKNEKGELLEQITGTEIYGKISRIVFENTGKERKKLEKIEIELESINILNDEEIQALNEEIAAAENEKIKLDKELVELDKAKNWLKEITELGAAIEKAKEKIPDLEKEKKSADEKVDETKKQVEAATQHLKDQKPIFKKVSRLDTQIDEKSKTLAPILEKIGELEDDKKAVDQKIIDQKAVLEKSKTTLYEKESWAKKNKKFEKLVNDFTAIDQKNTMLTQTEEEVVTLKIELDKVEKDHSTKGVDLEKFSKVFDEKSDQLTLKEKELTNKRTELSNLLDGKELDELQYEKETKTTFNNHIETLLKTEKSIIATQQEIEKHQQVAKKTKTDSSALSSLIEKDKKTAEQIASKIELLTENIQLAKKVQSLEAHRQNLKDGEPCPLCGAEEHPYAIGNTPKLDDKEIQLANEKTEHKSLSEKIHQNENRLSALDSDYKNVVQNKEKEEQNLTELKSEKSTIVESINLLDTTFRIPEGQDLLQTINNQFEQNKNELQKINSLIEKAQDVRKEIKVLRDKVIPELLQEKETAKSKKSEAETDFKLAGQQLKIKTETHKQKQASFEKEQAKFLEELKVYGVDTITALQKCLTEWESNQTKIKSLKEEIEGLKNKIKLEEKELESLQKSLSEKEKEKARSQKELDALKAERKELFGDKSVEEEEKRLEEVLQLAEKALESNKKDSEDVRVKLKETAAVLQEKKKALEKKSAEKLTDKTDDEIGEIQIKLKTEADEFAEKIGENREKLRANKENIQSNEQKLKEKEKQTQIYAKWKNLDNLIGSSDGKKYRNFAQALTFEHLIGLANKQLQKMSDRYILKRHNDVKNPFELAVIDKFQNNDERTAQNLSGGEKFIVSLSLALGLSTMASKNMRIDTMFIDEGFGTLDSDYLDVALNALSNLQNDGKIIGVISHIAELKERIATHIEIVPGGNGRSKVVVS